MVAINHSRAQILAPHREVDPWAGLDRAAAAEAAAADAAAAGRSGSGAEGAARADRGIADPWGFERADGAQPEPNPWGPGVAQDPWGNGPATPPAKADKKR
jgi:hypothetical protein